MTSRLIALCLACSSSPPPRAQSSPPFTTLCCARPICSKCLSKNPRLRGYNPCLACLAGVAVVGRSRTAGGISNVHVAIPGPSGQSQDEERNVFILGDSDDDDPKPDSELKDAPPPYTEASEPGETAAVVETLPGNSLNVVMDGEGSNPSKYYIQPRDTLRGIALRYNVDGRKICQLNSLPFSTLSTTPHLLHTRRWLNLPPIGRRVLLPDLKPLEAEEREQAEKRFQFVTKEVDWRIAKAYVALAEDEDDSVKTKEDTEVFGRSTSEQTALEAKAVDKYLDDEEWEARQDGGPQLQGFPPFAASSNKNTNCTTLRALHGKLTAVKY